MTLRASRGLLKFCPFPASPWPLRLPGLDSALGSPPAALEGI